MPNIKNYSANNASLIISGVPIENLSKAGYSIEYIDEWATARTGLNGAAIENEAQTKPVRVVINLMPDSDEKHTLLALKKTRTLSGASSHTQIGTGEKIALFMPVFKGIGSRTRGVQTAEDTTDDVLTFEFMDSEEV